MHWRETSERFPDRNLSSGSGNDYIGRYWLRYLGYSYFYWKIGSVPIKWILLAAALITFGVMAYFDRNLPGKNYRSSIIWLECIVEAFTLACIFGNSIISFWDIDNMTENIVFILIIAVIMLCLFAARIIVARTNREEYEMQKNADKHETEQ